MGKLEEQNRWEEDVYLIEKQDKVLGGTQGVINQQALQLANRTQYLKNQVDGINRERTGYAPKANPAFTGIPTAPTANQNTNNTQIATTAFVKTAIAALVGSAPAALDTLEELARALAGDANLKQTLLTEIGKKANQVDFIALHDLFIGVPIPYPTSAVPTGCLAMNGQRFDKARYPKLGQKYPSGVLPDLRGEFIRGWDNGRGIDAGRGLLSAQRDDFGSHYHGLMTGAGGGSNLLNLAVIVDGIALNSGVFSDSFKASNEDIKDGVPVRTFSSGGNETRPRNIAYHYICLAA